MSRKEPQLSFAGLSVLRYFLDQPRREVAGAELAKALGLGSGTLYPLLHRFEEAGWLTSNWENVDPKIMGRPKQRNYLLTAKGQNEASKRLNALGLPAGEPSWA